MTLHDPVPNMPRFTGARRAERDVQHHALQPMEPDAYERAEYMMRLAKALEEAFRCIDAIAGKMPEDLADELNGYLPNTDIFDVLADAHGVMRFLAELDEAMCAASPGVMRDASPNFHTLYFYERQGETLKGLTNSMERYSNA